MSFALDRVRDLVAETQGAADHLPYFGFRGPHLWLAADHGLYLLSNRADRPAGETAEVVYARECDPRTMAFEDWWAAKTQIWGRDDGVQPIALELVSHALDRAPPEHSVLALDLGWRSWLTGGVSTS